MRSKPPSLSTRTWLSLLVVVPALVADPFVFATGAWGCDVNVFVTPIPTTLVPNYDLILTASLNTTPSPPSGYVFQNLTPATATLVLPGQDPSVPLAPNQAVVRTNDQLGAVSIRISHPEADSPLVWASSVTGLTFEVLENWTNRRFPSSLEDLIRMLPRSLRGQYALMHSSHSLQGGTFDEPRALMITPDGKLVVSFNGNPDPPQSTNPSRNPASYNDLEIVQFRDATNSFEFRKITVVDGHRTVSEANPPICMGCHLGYADSPRPNWEPYSTWPGAYGSSSDYSLQESRFDSNGEGQAYSGTTERDAIFQWMSPAYARYYGNHPRYRHLLNVEQNFAMDFAHGLPSHYAGHNSAVFNKRLAQLNFRRIAHLIATTGYSSEIYPDSKFLTAFLLSDCRTLFLNTGEFTDAQLLPSRFVGSLPTGMGMRDANGETCNYGDYFAALGYDRASWTMGFFGDPCLSIPSFIERPQELLLYELAQRDSQIRFYVQTDESCTSIPPSRFAERTMHCRATIDGSDMETRHTACLILANKARTEISKLPALPPPP